VTLAAGGTVNIADLLGLGIVAVQAGTYTATITASTNTSNTVTFPVPFTNTPRVLVAPPRTAAGSAVGSFFQITALSATSVTIRWGIAASTTTSCSVDWVAVQTA
jgi:hypothetical protein